MNRRYQRLLTAMAALILNPISIAAIAEEVPERAAIPTAYKWDLSGM